MKEHDFEVGDEITWIGPQSCFTWYGDGQRCKIVGIHTFGLPEGFDIRPVDDRPNSWGTPLKCWTMFERMAREWKKVLGTPEEQVSDWIDKVRAHG